MHTRPETEESSREIDIPDGPDLTDRSRPRDPQTTGAISLRLSDRRRRGLRRLLLRELVVELANLARRRRELLLFVEGTLLPGSNDLRHLSSSGLRRLLTPCFSASGLVTGVENTILVSSSRRPATVNRLSLPWALCLPIKKNKKTKGSGGCFFPSVWAPSCGALSPTCGIFW